MSKTTVGHTVGQKKFLLQEIPIWLTQVKAGFHMIAPMSNVHSNVENNSGKYSGTKKISTPRVSYMADTSEGWFSYDRYDRWKKRSAIVEIM